MEFVEIARFSSRLEAEAIGHALDQYDIPFLVQSSDIGVFGPGHVGRSPVGAALCVPADRVGEVHELLSCLVTDTGPDENDEGSQDPLSPSEGQDSEGGDPEE